MYEYQYLVGGALSFLVSMYVASRRPRTLALMSLSLFGIVMSIWEISSFLYRTAPDAITSASFFRFMILASHLGFPIYLLTILNVRERRNSKFSLLVLIPAVIQTVIMLQSDYLLNYEFFQTELGWAYRVVGFGVPLIAAGFIFVCYLTGIAFALIFLVKKARLSLLRKKYIILLVSFVSFQVLGTTLTNTLIAVNMLSPDFQMGGIFQFLTFVSIWYALAVRDKEIPLSIVGVGDFSQVYSSFLTVYYNSVVGSRLGEESFEFTGFLRKSKMSDWVSFDEDGIRFTEPQDFDLAELINTNLRIFSKSKLEFKVLDHYLRVLNAAYSELSWKFDEIVNSNLDFLKRSDLIYGIADGKLLHELAQDESLKDLGDVEACLRIYKRVLLPIIHKIKVNTYFRKKLSEHYVTKVMEISDFGEISIEGVKEQLLRMPKGLQVQVVIERFNSILSSAYEQMLLDSEANLEDALEKLRLVLTLNKNRAVSLGIYPTLLGMLATKIPKTQIHKLYSDFLEELVEERTKELEEAQQNLLKTQRLAAIGEVAAMVGHDLRNPLQAIVNTLYLAEKKVDVSMDEEFKEILKTINEQVGYMNKIVSDLQDYARPVKPQLVETNLQQLVDETLSSIKVPKNVEVSIEIEEDVSKFFTDPLLLMRIFTNLIANALQAMPEGGQLTIQASRIKEKISIIFKDTGKGISEENLGKMFQPLFTTKAKGQGFGLPVCKRLIEALEGNILVERNLGRGATFKIQLPFRSIIGLKKTALHLPQVESQV